MKYRVDFKRLNCRAFAATWTLLLGFINQNLVTGAFLGAFAKERLISFFMPVSVSVRMEHFGSHWTDFYEIWYLSVCRKFVLKIQVPLNSDNNNQYCT